MARTRQVAIKSTGGKAPRKRLSAAGGARKQPVDEYDEDMIDDDEEEEENEGDGELIVNGGGEIASPGSVPEVRNLYQTEPDKQGKVSWTTKYPDNLDEPVENSKSKQYALIVRNTKCYDGIKKLAVQSIIVQSELLKEALGVVFQDYPGIVTNLDRLEFSAPFHPFIHRWEQFAAYRKRELDAKLRSHLELLWKILEEELRAEIRQKNDHIAKAVTSFDSFWAICEPGSWMYIKDEEHERIMKLDRSWYGSNMCGEFFYMACKYIDWDGEKFGFGNETVEVPKFQGTKSITALEVFPLAFHHNKESVLQKLTERGQKFISLKGYHFRAYDGIAIGQGMFGPIRFNVTSRVILDTFAYNRFNPNRKVNLERAKNLNEHVDPELLPLCTWKLRGYSLKDKKWLEFAVDTVDTIVWDEHAFKSLVAPEEQKELILAFAQSQAKNKNAFDDVIKGKGRGIIMLLSGPPGVGKTLTAEAVSETMRVPLYTMSAGDLGTQPSQVESSLSNILEMNQKWNAVLLLDEADVFLEARSAHDLERNKLVSIFLRLLEYYEGILFLTTNRVDDMDAAFESRIHLSLQYDELDMSQRTHIWRTFINRTANACTFTDDQVETLAKPQMNGRQIKNVIKTAQLLASQKEQKLNFNHISTVVQLRQHNALKRKAGAAGMYA